MEKPLIYSVKDQTAWLVINREPQRNALTHETLSLFMRRLDEAEADDGVRVVAVSGAGEKAFCSGADLAGAAGGDMKKAFGDYAALLKRIASFPKPTAAIVNGHCMAGGMGLMLACDIVIAKDTAKFGTPEANVGLWPMMIGALIYRNAPRKKAMEMMLLGKKMDAAQALEMGLVTRIFPPQKMAVEAEALLKNLASKSPIGMKIGKQAFYEMQDMPFEKALDFLSEKISDVAATKDAKEGIMAFLEKRKPEFTGK
jgi:enoyl-CoA hydratase/carnithine racemase